jgi:hypothetical protein
LSCVFFLSLAESEKKEGERERESEKKVKKERGALAKCLTYNENAR